MLINWSVTCGQNDNYTDIYDAKMANCCQKVRGNKTNPKTKTKQTKQTNKTKTKTKRVEGDGGGGNANN